MGLLDMFGGGGGSLSIRTDATRVASGATLSGAVSFEGGKRAQEITSISMKFLVEQTTMETTQVNGQPVTQPRTNSRDLVPLAQLAGAFQSTPGQPTQFPFYLQLPSGLLNSTPKQVKYRLVATADIDNAIDPGTFVEIEVFGGTEVAPHAAPPQPAQPAATPAGKFAQEPAHAKMAPAVVASDKFAQAAPSKHDVSSKHDASTKGVPQDGKAVAQEYSKGGPQDHAKGAPVAASFQLGQQVQAQHPSGQWYLGRISAMQNGMIGVDWDDAKVGESCWVQPAQVRGQ